MKKLFALAAVLTLSAPLAAQAAVISQDLVLSPYTTQSSVQTVNTTADGTTTVAPAIQTLSPIMVTPGNTTELNVLNPTPKDVTFASPDLGINVVIPANAQQRVFIDASKTAMLQPGQQVAFMVTDADGNQLASSFIQNQQVAYNYQQQSVTSTEQQTESSQTVTQPSPAPVENVQPTVQQSAPVERSTTVRGYW